VPTNSIGDRCCNSIAFRASIDFNFICHQNKKSCFFLKAPRVSVAHTSPHCVPRNRGTRLIPLGQDFQTRVGIVSREPLRLAGILSVFENYPTVVPVHGSIEELLNQSLVRVIVVDITENRSWLEMLTMVRRERPEMRFVLLGESGDEDMVMRAILAGARAYLDHKSGPFLVRQAVEVVLQGSIWAPRRLLSLLVDRLMEAHPSSLPGAQQKLSRREGEVMALLMQAYSNREIAESLGIEERTVKAYVSSLMRKTGADNRVALSIAGRKSQVDTANLR
jgi:DNA-binding NarL/FixJ family response regulator